MFDQDFCKTLWCDIKKCSGVPKIQISGMIVGENVWQGPRQLRGWTLWPLWWSPGWPSLIFQVCCFKKSLHWFTELLKQTSYQMLMKASAVHSVTALMPVFTWKGLILPNLKHKSYCEVSVVNSIGSYWWTQYLGASDYSCVFYEMPTWNTIAQQVNKYNQRRHIVRHAKTHHTCFSLGETQT